MSAKPNKRESLLTPKEAAKIIGVSTWTIGKWARAGRIDHIQRVPRGTMWLVESSVRRVASEVRKDHARKATKTARAKAPCVCMLIDQLPRTQAAAAKLEVTVAELLDAAVASYIDGRISKVDPDSPAGDQTRAASRKARKAGGAS